MNPVLLTAEDRERRGQRGASLRAEQSCFFTMTAQIRAINLSLPQIINLDGTAVSVLGLLPMHEAQLGRDGPSALPEDSGRQRLGGLGVPYTRQLQTPQAVPPRSLEYISLARGRATAWPLTSAFSSLLWASTCATISFMLVSSTMPPITTSCKMW